LIGGILSFILFSFIELVSMALNFYMWILIVAVLMTWVNPDPYNAIVQFIRQATEPFLSKIRQVIPLQFGGMDFSPIAAIFLVHLSNGLVLQIFSPIAKALR